MRNTTHRPGRAHRGRKAAFAALVIATLTASLSPSVATAADHRGTVTPWVAYQSSLRDGQFGLDGIFLVRPDGSNDHEIATSLPGQHIHPDWSTDGRSLVFRADIGDFSQLFLTNPVTDPTGHRAQQLTNCADDCVQVDDPALSPDGASVAYVEDTGIVTVDTIDVPASFDLRIARITRDGLTDVRTIVHSKTLPQSHTVTELVEPRWSPDGRSLAF